MFYYKLSLHNIVYINFTWENIQVTLIISRVKLGYEIAATFYREDCVLFTISSEARAWGEQ